MESRSLGAEVPTRRRGEGRHTPAHVMASHTRQRALRRRIGTEQDGSRPIVKHLPPRGYRNPQVRQQVRQSLHRGGDGRVRGGLILGRDRVRQRRSSRRKRRRSGGRGQHRGRSRGDRRRGNGRSGRRVGGSQLS